MLGYTASQCSGQVSSQAGLGIALSSEWGYDLVLPEQSRGTLKPSKGLRFLCILVFTHDISCPCVPDFV